MSKITLDNLSDNLKAYLEGLGLTEEQVLNLINENGLNEEELKAMLKDTMSINELSTNSKTIIGAINELFQSANNGKELIASAIGEPLSSEDTFSAMSNDINGLLSTFKTNMMNNGITVEASDKFKSLIDKIATMVEEGSGKGIKFAEGIHDPTDYIYNTDYDIETNLDFTPTLVFCVISNYVCTDANQYQNYVISNFTQTDTHSGYSICYIKNVTASKFTLHTFNSNRYIQINGRDSNVTLHWYAIGVGEEDTTLRDSLADILENKGLDVTEEDDMASLITKVEDMDTIISNEPQVLCYTESCVEYTFESTVRGDDYFDVFIKDNYAYFIVQDSYIVSSYLNYNAKAIKYDLINKIIVNEVVIFENYDYRRRVADSYLINDEIILFVDFGIYSLKLNDLSITNLYRNTNTDPAAPNIIKTDDYIYCATGGYNNEDDPLIYRYNITSRKVDKTASLPRATYNSSYRNYRIYFLGFDKLNGYLYVSGGGYTHPITQFDLELKTIVSVDLYDTTAAYSTYNSRYAFGNNNIISWLGYSNGNYLQFFTMDITNVESTFTKTPVNFPCNINCIYSGNMNYTEKPEIPCIGFTDQYMYIKCNDSFIRVDTTTKSLEYVPIPIYFKKFRIIDDETIECPTPAGLYRLKIKQI